MKIVAFHGYQGGVGNTQCAASTCIRGRESGLDVVGATLGRNHDLRPHLQHAGVRWLDGLDVERLPETCDLLVLDIGAGSGLLDVVKPDLWIVPMRKDGAPDNAIRLLPSLEGMVWWLPTQGYVRHVVPEEARGRVTLARPIPNSDAMIQSFDAIRPVWAEHRRSSAAAAVESFIANIFAFVDLAGARRVRRLAYRGRPTRASEVIANYEAREAAARPRLAAYFENIRRQRSN